MSDLYLSVFEMIGTIAFAVSGAVMGIKHRMDVFGVTILGLVTAVGGGIIRDLVIGQIPPRAFVHPKFGLVAILTSLVTFAVMALLHQKQERHEKLHRWLEIILFHGDTLGLAAFTVLGIQGARSAVGDQIWLLLFVGVITGVGGGVLRDMMACTVPSIFRKYIYATASLAGAAADVLLSRWLGQTVGVTAGFILVVLLRNLASHFHWNYPRIDWKEPDQKENK